MKGGGDALPEAMHLCFQRLYPSPTNPRLGPSASKEKAQFENLLPKEAYTCGRGSGEFGARLWGEGASRDWLRGFGSCLVLHIYKLGLPGSLGEGKLERTALCEVLLVEECINSTWILEGKISSKDKRIWKLFIRGQHG